MGKNQAKQLEEPAAGEHKSDTLHALRGMRDILPDEAVLWQRVMRAAERVARDFRFERIVLPVVEPVSLYARLDAPPEERSAADMCAFRERNAHDVSLRPSLAPSVARSYFEHGMQSRPQPVRLWDIGATFRYDASKASGRLRQFWQMNFEIVGDAHPVTDALLMQAACAFFADLGLPATLAVNSVGDAGCRGEYLNALRQYLGSAERNLCAQCQHTHAVDAFSLFRCSEPACQEALADAPQIVDWLCVGCRQHFIQVLEYLDELDISYVLEPTIIPGAPHHCRTAFELILSRTPLPQGGGDPEGRSSPLVAGGRRDIVGGEEGRSNPVPAIGFTTDIERIASRLRECMRTDGTETAESSLQIFIAQLGNEARKEALKLFKDLRAAGYRVAESFNRDGLSHQLDMAIRLRCRYTLILGQKELIDKTIIIRDMESGIQEIVDSHKVTLELGKRLQSVPSLAVVSVRTAGEMIAVEAKKFDFRREEYLISQSVAMEEEGEGAMVMGDAKADEETLFEETELEEAAEGEGGGLRWVSEDYGDEDGDREV